VPSLLVHRLFMFVIYVHTLTEHSKCHTSSTTSTTQSSVLKLLTGSHIITLYETYMLQLTTGKCSISEGGKVCLPTQNALFFFFFLLFAILYFIATAVFLTRNKILSYIRKNWQVLKPPLQTLSNGSQKPNTQTCWIISRYIHNWIFVNNCTFPW